MPQKTALPPKTPPEGIAPGAQALAALAAAILRVSSLDLGKSWDENGGDSLDAVNLAMVSEDELGRRIDPLRLLGDTPVKDIFDSAEPITEG